MSNLQLFDHEFNGRKIRQRSEDGYVNLTDMSKAGSKTVASFLRLKETKAYIAVVAADVQIHTSAIVQISKGGDDQTNQGTWAHHLVAIAFARRISPEFAVWADKQLTRIIDNDPTLTTELLDRMPDKAAAVLISDRIETMEDLSAVELVQQTASQKIAALLEKAGLPYGESVPTPKLSEEKYDRALSSKHAHESWQVIDGVTWFCPPGTDTWQVDCDTKNYQDYCLWREWYPKNNLPLAQSIEALRLIKSVN
jgi:hypothetical protein